MENDEQTSALASAAQLRIPRITPENRDQRVEILADHILETAHVRGLLAALRMEAHIELLGLRAEWATAGHFRPGKGVQANEQLKREENPELAARMDKAKWIIERCNEELDRLGGSDYDAASRAYTLIAGS